MKRAMILAMVVLCTTAMVSTAEATTITTGGTIEFQGDGFENDTVATDPSATSVGSWYLNQQYGNAEVFGPASGGPGAYEGNNYLSLARTGGSNYKGFTACEKLANTAAVGTTVVTENGIYFPTGGGGLPHITFDQGTSLAYPTGRVSWVTFDRSLEPDGYLGIKYHHYAGDDAGAHLVTTNGGTQNMVVSEDAWHSLVHNMIVGTSFTMTLDGVVSDPIPIEAQFQSLTVGGLHFLFNSADGQYYVDGVVPEPGTMALLATGLIGLLCYAWRKRK